MKKLLLLVTLGAIGFCAEAQITVLSNGNVGITGNGSLTDYINVYRTKTNFVHGAPGNP